MKKLIHWIILLFCNLIIVNITFFILTLSSHPKLQKLIETLSEGYQFMIVLNLIIGCILVFGIGIFSLIIFNQKYYEKFLEKSE